MTDAPTTPPPAPGGRVSLGERVKNILVTPKTEWPRIDAEPATIGSLFTGYVMILAAIGPVAGLIGQQLFGISGFGVSYKPPLATSLINAVIGYVLSLASVYVLALIVNALAPTFSGTKDQVKAFKVCAYGMTAAWVAGILALIPPLAILAFLGGLYSLYLIYLGLPRLMRSPEDKAIGYTAVVVIAAIVLYFVAAMVVGALVLATVGLPGAVNQPVVY